ncbi:MAG: TIGR03862 family flavoprotein, partial [Betaproteobacteria bacterium]|nr:TIGR03862 family flavoprotein [Betaproteobacteria bacterium]
MPTPASPLPHVAIIGGGPAGLMAAEVLAAGLPPDRARVTVYDAMPSVGRKFLMAGKGGMNITHSEGFDTLVSRYGAARERLEPLLREFGPEQLRQWIHGLGITTFVGTSGRVFPTEMKAAPLLRVWLHRLREAGVEFKVRHRWLGWTAAGTLRFATPEGEIEERPAATVLALGGGSWAKLGSDGAWVPLLRQTGAAVADLQPANCGFDAAWSQHFREHFAGEPIKPVIASCLTPTGETLSRQGEFVVTESGVEGGLIYALSAPLRDVIARDGCALLHLDLLPGHIADRVLAEVQRPRGSRSLSSHLQSRLGLKGVKMGLLRECLSQEQFQDPAALAAGIKALPVRLLAPRPLDEAISSAGGVGLAQLDEH